MKALAVVNYRAERGAVELAGFAALELAIIPDIGGGEARARLQSLRLA